MMMVSNKIFLLLLQFFTLLYLFANTFASTEEATALLKWKSTFKNQNNSLLASWKPSFDACSGRYGVICFNGRVNRLNINNSRVIGTLYDFPFSSLPFLEYFKLSMNNFYGTIPPEIGNLTNLICLDLHANQISGTIPSQIGSLVKLQILHIFDNHLNGPILEEIGYLRSLTKLSLGENFLNGSIPASLGNLYNSLPNS
ncbi:MDIS1-interacting receptor like kinase 2-like [Capsicum annuum]|uniref:MDIS1-interacting receptor like kinase 2-like n=1 Tax=Capsicum annuum TaxID=4072 RepID=UPI001FB11238|nr:MDIS1-interacting receptor like kinase 2-like [Capsicum annuum]